MSDFRTVLIEDSRIADITATEVFGVQASASQSTYQQFQAVSTSNSSVVFNVQIPSENIVIDRHVLLSSQVAFQLRITGVPATKSAFAYGETDALQAFPLNSLFTTTQATINNVSVSTNLQDVLPMLMRMTEPKELMKYNSTTPALPDCAWGMYLNAPGSNSNPVAGYGNAGYDAKLQPRGAYKLDEIIIDHYNGSGVYQNDEVISDAEDDVWYVFIKVTLTEPFLALSPFINCQPENSAGIVGVNNMSMVLNVDSTCKRFFSTANSKVENETMTTYIKEINLGWVKQPHDTTKATVATGLIGAKLLFNFLSLQPEQYAKISTKNVVPYLDYPRYLSTFASGTTLGAYGSTSQPSTALLTSQSIQLNQVPDLILISVRVPMSSQNWGYSSSFLTINSISVNFNNSSGLLASATQQDLYNISARNGSSQSYYEFAGSATIYDADNASTGLGVRKATTGSLLVLNPVMDFGLPSYLSSSSLGQYQLQFNVNVTNQFDYSVAQPEICIVTVNSGVFATQQGTSQIFTGILTKEQVLRTKEQNPVPHLDSVEYKRLVGGRLQNRGMGNLMKMVRDKMMARHVPPAVPAGGAMSAGAMSGAGISAGKKSSSKLAKFLA